MAVAVLIVNFRGYGDLHRCLGSLAPHLRADDEVIVVDHESDPRQLKTVEACFPGLTAIPTESNAGFAAGVNLAARHATTPFLLLLNPDTIVQGPVLAVLETWLRQHPGTHVIGPRVLNPDGSTQPSARRRPGVSTLFGGRSSWLTRRRPGNWWSKRNLLGLDARTPLDVDWIAGACLMTRRDVFERLGGLDERFFLYWEDADYCRRVNAAGGRCTYLPLLDVKHFGGGSARYDPAVAIRAFHESAYYLYWKRSGIAGRLLAPLVRVALRLRGEWRLRRALREQPASGVDLVRNACDPIRACAAARADRLADVERPRRRASS